MSPNHGAVSNTVQILTSTLRLWRSRWGAFLSIALVPALWWVVCALVIIELVGGTAPNPNLREVWALMSVPKSSWWLPVTF